MFSSIRLICIHLINLLLVIDVHVDISAATIQLGWLFYYRGGFTNENYLFFTAGLGSTVHAAACSYEQ